MINVIQLRDIIYPSLLLLSFMMFGSLVATYILIDRTRVIMAVAVYFLLQTVVFALLILATGADPVIDINSFRLWIIYIGIVMSIVLFVCVILQMERVIKQR